MILCCCGMISYCCEQHRIMDQSEFESDRDGHERICNVIRELTDQGLMRRFPGGTLSEWKSYTQHYVRYVEEKLSRELQPHEKQMIWYARSCDICHKETNLEICEECFSIDFCEDHVIEKAEHDECTRLKKWLYFEMQAINVITIPEWQTFHDFPVRSNVEDMDSFCRTYLLPMKNAPWSTADIAYSDYASWPLTLYYGLKEASLFNIAWQQDCYVIHILEANNVDRRNLTSWEILLHTFRKPMKLIVVLIGRNLAPELEDMCGLQQICWEKCMPIGHQFYFQYFRMLYEDYVSSSFFTAPNVIIGFQVGFKIEQWLKFNRTIDHLFCPVILTSNTESTAQENARDIKSIVNCNLELVIQEENRFQSFRPYRDHVTGRVFYFNKYLLIFKNLNSLDESNHIESMSSNDSMASS